MGDLYSAIGAIMNSPVTSFALALIALASLAYAVYCRHFPSEKAELRYHVASFTLIDDAMFPMDGDFSFCYKEKPIEKCEAAIVSIWNNGNKPLELSDLAPKGQLAFACRDEGAMILDARILSVTKEENGIRLFTVDKRKRTLLFDYLGEQNGAKILLLHTGDKNTISIEGMLKSGLEIKPIYPSGSTSLGLMGKSGLQLSIFVFLIIACVTSWSMTALCFLTSMDVVSLDVLYSVGRSASQLRTQAATTGLLFAAISTATTLFAANFFRKARRSNIPSAIR